jgi:hypothetical protein
LEKTFTHAVTYTNSGRVPVSDVAASLLANERLVREAIGTLEDLFPGLTIEDVSIVFRRASSDSPLQEAIEVVGNIVFQGKMHEQVPDLVRRLTGQDFPKSMDGLVTILVMAIAVYGVFWLAKKLGKDGEAGTLHIEGNYNQVIQVGRDLLAVDEGQLKSAIEGRFAKGRGAPLAKRALELIRPARREDGAAVEGAGVRIDPETIAASASPLDLAMDEDESHDPYGSQPVIIHATDLDSNKSGWAGHLPGLWEKRLPMRLSPTIPLDEIYGKREIVADIVLSSRKDATGDFVPFVFHVMKIA